MQTFTLLATKFSVIFFLVFALFIASSHCLAQEKKQTKSESRQSKIDTIAEHSNAISRQKKKLHELYADTIGIGKGIQAQESSEIEIMSQLFHIIDKAGVLLDAPQEVLNLYEIMLYDCQPNKTTTDITKRSLDRKKEYEFLLDDINTQLGRTKKPAIALLCDKMKTEIRNSINTLEEAKEALR